MAKFLFFFNTTENISYNKRSSCFFGFTANGLPNWEVFLASNHLVPKRKHPSKFALMRVGHFVGDSKQTNPQTY